jgi:arylsulfatase A-like enzyme
MLHHYGTDRQSDYETWLRTIAGPDRGLFDHGLGANEWSARPWHLDEWMHPTYWATSRAVEFVRNRDKERPFFMMLSYVAPHPPYVPPQCYWDMYAQREMPPAPVGDWVARFPRDPEAGRWLPDAQFGHLDERSRRRAQIGYYGLITQIDHQIGRLFEHLADHRLLKDTIILFVSDHGEMLGDHYFWRKTMPYAGSARVPMILYMPGEKPGLARAGAGATIDAPVELRDVMPTLLDAAGLKTPEGIDGQSLLPLYRGQETSWRSHIHGEHTQGGLSNHYITDGRFLYAWFSQLGLEQLFDTRTDPQELHDLSGESSQRPVLERLRDAMIHELTGREEGYVSGGKLVVGRPTQSCLRSVMDRR